MIKTIVISDFSGGLNVADDPLQIADNQCVASSFNVWAPNQYLTKTPGFTIAYNLTASASFMTFGNNMISDFSASTATGLYFRAAQTGQANNNYPYAGIGFSPLGYTTGSVSISGASLISATGSGTSWNTQVSANDSFGVGSPPNTWRTVSSVEDDTHLTLTTAVTAAVATGSSYMVQQKVTQLGGLSQASLGGYIVYSGENDTPQLCTVSTCFRLPSAPRAAFLATHKNYMFAARTSTATSRLYWSTLKDPTSWPATNFIDIDKDKDSITGLKSVGNELIIFKRTGMYKLTGEVFDSSAPTYAVYPIAVPSSFVFVQPNTAAIHNGNLIFYCSNGFYVYVPGSQSIKLISTKLFGTLATSFTGDGLWQALESRGYAISYNGFYICKGLTYNTGSYEDRGFILDRNGAWWAIHGNNVAHSLYNPLYSSPLCVESPPQLTPRLITTHGAGTAPRIYAFDVEEPGPFEDQYISVTNGSEIAIPATWTSKEFNIRFGTFKELILYYKKQSAGTLTVSWTIDQGASVSNSIDMSAGRGAMVRKTLPINRPGSTIQITISNSTVNENFQIYGMEIRYEEDLANRLA